jgi:hypothetical protein
MTADAAPPRVFISYSHDSREHKQWVAEFATQLVHAGVEVILDQWDLSFGADVPKFMERGVAEADRVLLICTPPYVRKADDGLGGVGYEAMIVTAQLIKDLGTAKFVPVVRALGEPPVPLALGTRLYVDLSSPDRYAEGFESLLRSLHRAPAIRRPQLGKNPFFDEQKVPAPRLQDSAADQGDGGLAYAQAVKAVRSGDLYEWRRLLRSARDNSRGSIAVFLRDVGQTRPLQKDHLSSFVLNFAASYESLFATALAGVESGDPRFCNQQSILDEILNPSGWSLGGFSIVVALPRAVAFIYQALHGAVCVETGQLALARRLARTRVDVGNSGNKDQLLKSYDLVGYGESFSGEPRIAWDTLRVLFERWPWLAEIFGDGESFRVAMVAYYLLLNTMELVVDLAAGREFTEANGPTIFDVPLMFSFEDIDVRRRAYSLFMRNPEHIRELLRESDVVDSKFKATWPVWVKEMKRKAADGWSPSLQRSSVPHADLVEDLDAPSKAG